MTHSDSNRRTQATGVLLLAALALGAIPASGCFSGRARSSSASSEASEAYTGEVTIENRSSLRICRLMMIQDDGAVGADVELGQGDTATLDITARTNRLYVTECGGARTLLGHPMNWYGSAQGRTELLQGLSQDRIVLYDPGQAPANASDHRALDLNPRPVSDWIFFTGYADPSLARSLQDVIAGQAQREGWSETIEFTIPLSDWNIIRHRRTGVIMRRELQGAAFARWPDGHCTMQAFGFQSPYNGSGFGSPQYGGSSTQLHIPCAALAHAAGLPAASPNSAASGVSAGGGAASSSAGGMCTNTCRSANDGECDDGGPGSLYNVCSLGTDCADCGARSSGGPAASPSGGGGGSCTNTCNSANDGECDDGGPGSLYSVCGLGTDCADCGAR